MNTEDIASKIKDPEAREHFRIMQQKEGIVERALRKTFELEDCIVVSNQVNKRLEIYEKQT